MMRFATFMAIVTLMVAFVAAKPTISDDVVAPSSCPPMPVTGLSIFQKSPFPYQTGMYQWYFSLCSPGTDYNCDVNSQGYIIQSAGVCGSFQYATGNWTHQYGGLNMLYSGYLLNAASIANLTLLCDPEATTPVADGDVLVTADASPVETYYAIRLKTKSVCPFVTPTPAPSTAPATPAPIPTSARVVWSTNTEVSYTGNAPGMILTDTLLIAQTDNATAATVTGIDPVSGQQLFQTVDHSEHRRRTGLVGGAGTGLFFQETMLSSPNSFAPVPAVVAYDTNGGAMRWTRPRSPWVATPPRFFKGSVYVSDGFTMDVVDASSGRFLADRSSNGLGTAGDATASFTLTDRHGVTTDAIICAWGQTTAFNVTDPANPTQLWNTTKMASGSLFVTPDQQSVFMATSSSVGAFDTATGTLEAGFSIINVPSTTVPFSASNAALFAISTVGLDQYAITLIAYSRADGSVLWKTELAPFALSSTCSFEPENATMVCTINSAGQYGSFLGVQLVKVDPGTGAILWQATLPPSEGSIHAGARYKPLIVGTNSIVVLWSSGASGAYSFRRLEFVTG